MPTTGEPETTAAARADVCLVARDAAEAAQLAARLAEDDCAVVREACGRDGLAMVRRSRPAVVVCDAELPDMGGLEFLQSVRGDHALDGVFVILVAEHADAHLRRAALHGGVDDFLVKPLDLDELEARLRSGLRISRLQEELRQAAVTDGLTGLANHARFREQLEREFTRARRYGGVVSLLMIDLDHFKAVNDTFGHEIGNEVLQRVARGLRQRVREIDLPARYGGEEFAVICPETTLDDAFALAGRIRQSLAERARVASIPQLAPTVSIGVAASNSPGVCSVADLINQADQALYVAKHAGRNCVVRCDAPGQPMPSAEPRAADVDVLHKRIAALSLQAKQLCLQSVWALVQAIEARDPATAYHSRNTMEYARELADAAGWSDNQRDILCNAAMLHAIGRIGVPDRILESAGALSPDDAALLRQVPLLSCRILEPLRVFETEIVIIRHLRERWDGSGYPNGLAGPMIPLGARFLAVAEAFDALTSFRRHRPVRSIDAALDVLRGESGRHFDPDVVALLAELADRRRAAWECRIETALAFLQHPAVAQTRAPD
ncbi:MAG: diguanylate cyclase [Phycisphaerales bacterium]|nr:diguanylate cyclase [Phycisphaerales bacterium]